MKNKPDSDGYYQPPNGFHYNVKYTAGVVSSRVTPRYFEGEKPTLIEWVWIVESKRYATAAEIAALCQPKRGSLHTTKVSSVASADTKTSRPCK